MTVPELDLADPEVLRDPFTAYAQAREAAPVAQLRMPGPMSLWVVTRYAPAKELLGDPRFEINSASYLSPDVPEDCLPYLRTMSEQDGPNHLRLRRLVAPAFTPRRTGEFRERIAMLVHRLLDEVAKQEASEPVDLFPGFARPLPMDVICALVGIPEADWPRWREYGAHIASGAGKEFAAAIPGIIAGAKDAVAASRAEPADNLVGDLVRVQEADGDRLSDTEIVSLVWHLVLAGQTPTQLILNGLAALFAHPEQLDALRQDPNLLPSAVEEMLRWCGPNLLTVPRFTTEDVDIDGITIDKGQPVSTAIAGVNRDPRVFDDPDRFDIRRTGPARAHLAFGHGPHFCLGASIARVQTEVALGALLDRFPKLAPATSPPDAARDTDGGSWRLTALPVLR